MINLTQTPTDTAKGGIYFSPSFIGSGNVLRMLFSANGSDWTECPASFPSLGRDPTPRYFRGYWWIAHTMVTGGNDFTDANLGTIKIIKSADLLNWSVVTTIDFTSSVTVTVGCVAWAPDFVQDGDDGTMRLTVSVTGGGIGGSFVTKRVESTDGTTWTSPTTVIITSGPSNVIDTCVIKRDDTYWMYYVNAVSPSKSIDVASSSTYEGPYAIQATNIVSSTTYEGPCAVLETDGSVSLYVDSTSGLGVYRFTSSGSMTSFSGGAAVTSTIKVRHGTVLKVTDFIQIARVVMAVAAKGIVRDVSNNMTSVSSAAMKASGQYNAFASADEYGLVALVQNINGSNSNFDRGGVYVGGYWDNANSRFVFDTSMHSFVHTENNGTVSIGSLGSGVGGNISLSTLKSAAGAKFGNNTAGFCGASPIARQLMPTGAGKLPDDIIAALQTFGLFKQS